MRHSPGTMFIFSPPEMRPRLSVISGIAAAWPTPHPSSTWPAIGGIAEHGDEIVRRAGRQLLQLLERRARCRPAILVALALAWV